MKKYHTGRTPDGRELFHIPLKADEDDMIGRECPNDDCQPKYFKMSTTIPDKISESIGDLSQIDVTCPYCGTVDNMQSYYTKAQLDWIHSMIFMDVAKTLQNMLQSSFRPAPRPSNHMFNVTFKPGPLPSVRHYAENRLKKTAVCDECGFMYAVYGMSLHCPLCGKGNLSHHLNRSATIIRTLLEHHETISQEKGHEIGQQLIGNALEDVVTLFETFLKLIYKYAINRRFPKEMAETKIRKIRTTFQRLDGAEALFSEDLGIELFGECTDANRRLLQEQFLKRHVLTHNLGLVDKKYMEEAHVYEKQGAEIDIDFTDVLNALEAVLLVVGTASHCVELLGDRTIRYFPTKGQNLS